MTNKIYNLFCNILSIPAFYVSIFFILLQITHYFTINKLKNYFSIIFPLSFQGSCTGINIIFLAENCPSWYQPNYLIVVFGFHTFLSLLNFAINNKFNRKVKNKLLLTVSSYVISIIALITLLYTMRGFLFRINI